MPPPPGAISTGNGLSVAGPLARSPEDLEIALDVLVAAQEQDSPAWKIKLPRARTKKVKELRIATWPDEPYAEVDDEISSLIKDKFVSKDWINFDSLHLEHLQIRLLFLNWEFLFQPHRQDIEHLLKLQLILQLPTVG